MRKLPKWDRIVVSIGLENAKRALQYLPKDSELRTKIKEQLEFREFYLFMDGCDYFLPPDAAFFTGFLVPSADMYCTHQDNKDNKKEVDLERALSIGIPEEKIYFITGTCDRKNCPIYKKAEK